MEGGDVGPNDNGARSESHADSHQADASLPEPQKRRKLEQIVIRFAGDSGDGMQLTGDRFTSEAALFGNDLATQPNYPAEIRAPAGTLPGVSSFQIHIADLPRGVRVIANSDEFTKRNLTKVGYVTTPLKTDE